MSDASGGDPRVHNLTTEEVARGLQEGRMLLVDVREPNEVARRGLSRRRGGAASVFDPAAIPDPAGQAGGVRLPLRPALGHCFSGGAGEGLPVRFHLAGGILAWKAAGLPTDS